MYQLISAFAEMLVGVHLDVRQRNVWLRLRVDFSTSLSECNGLMSLGFICKHVHVDERVHVVVHVHVDARAKVHVDVFVHCT